MVLLHLMPGIVFETVKDHISNNRNKQASELLQKWHSFHGQLIDPANTTAENSAYRAYISKNHTAKAKEHALTWFSYYHENWQLE